MYAKATGIGPKDIVEFFLIAQNSGHDYESLATAFAAPGDVHRALEFIGMESGRPIDAQKMRFWPKGERVIASVAALPPGPAFGPVRFDKLVIDSRSGESWSEGGLVFVGSELVDSLQRPGEKVYAADVQGPNSVASTYNEPTTVLDVPRRAVQAEVYGRVAPQADFMLPTNRLLEIVLQPEYTDGKRRVAELDLTARAEAESKVKTLNELIFDLTGAGCKKRLRAAKLNDVLEDFVSLVRDGHDPFVTLCFDDALPLGVIHELCAVLSSVETERGIRVEPPAEGQLYYKAFVPNEQNRRREERISQPWELHLRRDGSKIAAVLMHIEQVWKDDSIRPDLKITERAVATASDLIKALAEMGKGIPVILVYSPPDITHGELIELILPARATHPVIHVYLEKQRADAAVDPGG